MPPVEELANFPVFHSCKDRYRAGGEGGPLGVGRCSYSIYKDVLVNPTVQSVNLESFVGRNRIFKIQKYVHYITSLFQMALLAHYWSIA